MLIIYSIHSTERFDLTYVVGKKVNARAFFASSHHLVELEMLCRHRLNQKHKHLKVQHNNK